MENTKPVFMRFNKAEAGWNTEKKIDYGLTGKGATKADTDLTSNNIYKAFVF